MSMKNTKSKSTIWFSGALIVLLALILIAFYFAATLSPKPSNLERFKIGTLSALEVSKAKELAPNDAFLDPSKQPTNLESFRGSLVLVNVWASWCPPCVREMPSLAELSQKFGANGLKVVAISIDKPDKAQMAREKLSSLSNGKIEFYHDPLMRIGFALKVKGFPTSILYDQNGQEIARVSGAADWNSREATILIENLLLNSDK